MRRAEEEQAGGQAGGHRSVLEIMRFMMVDRGLGAMYQRTYEEASPIGRHINGSVVDRVDRSGAMLQALLKVRAPALHAHLSGLNMFPEEDQSEPGVWRELVRLWFRTMCVEWYPLSGILSVVKEGVCVGVGSGWWAVGGECGDRSRPMASSRSRLGRF